jgi:hypothetical protein
MIIDNFKSKSIGQYWFGFFTFKISNIMHGRVIHELKLVSWWNTG